MIVYAGKQFWNNFNNWDEGVFQDANRPRDDDMFMIRSWVQTRKQDLRTANSGIAAQGTFRSAKLQAWQALIEWNTAVMKDKFSYGDFSDINFTNTAWYTYTMNDFMGWLWSEIIWKPYVNAVDGDVVIGKSGVYAVTCGCEFIAPSTSASKITSTTFSSSAAFYKMYVSLLLNWLDSVHNQSRWCWWADVITVFYVWWFDTWDRLNVWFLHTDTADTFLCHPVINLYRLS